MKRFVKDPFFHFFIAAFFIYAVETAFSSMKEKEEIVISKNEITTLERKWKREYEKDPSKDEMEALTYKLSLDKTLLNEAIRTKIYEKDDKIFNALVTKMRSALKKGEPKKEPSEESLLNYYLKHKDDYRKDAKISFYHVFISVNRDDPLKKANELFSLLKESETAPEKTNTFADDFTPKNIVDADEQTITKLFGKSFYKQLSYLKPHKWHKPIISSKGVHIVYITGYKGGIAEPFSKVKEMVLADYLEDEKERKYRKKIETLYDKYKIVYK